MYKRFYLLSLLLPLQLFAGDFDAVKKIMHRRVSWFSRYVVRLGLFLLLVPAVTMILDSCYKNCTPVITMIDNFFKNRRMSNLVETKYAKGKLMIVTMDITSNLNKRPEAKQLRYSLLKYMGSKQFNPVASFSDDNFKDLFKD